MTGEGAGMVATIEVEGLTKFYRQLLAVDHISFDVQEGEIFGFLGPNGAGKTTTMRMLTNLTRPSEGAARIMGLDTVRDSIAVKTVIGIVPEASNTFSELTTLNNLVFTGALYGMRSRDRTKRAAELIEIFGLGEHREKRADQLSLGLRRRLTIAMSLMHGPRVVFLDEPTSGLDVESTRLIRNIVLDLHRQGVTVFVTTHNMEEANSLCQRIAVIDHGHLIAVNTPERLKQAATESQAVEISFAVRPGPEDVVALRELAAVSELRILGDKYHLVTSDPPAVLSALFGLVCARGLKPVSVSTLAASLEEVFVQLTGGKRGGTDG